ncbi:MAG: helix-turn-helix domain-containing protein [Candidatus Neomicrothrix subdominans]
MTHSQSNKLIRLLATARERRGISARELAKRSGVAASNIVRLERGEIARPTTETLDALATALELDSARLYEAAGYQRPAALPTFTPYLRSKYSKLPPAARAELETSFAKIAEKYGYDPAGPLPGEDETEEDIDEDDTPPMK